MYFKENKCLLHNYYISSILKNLYQKIRKQMQYKGGFPLQNNKKVENIFSRFANIIRISYLNTNKNIKPYEY